MSHYGRTPVLQIRGLVELVAALHHQGWKKLMPNGRLVDQVEVHQNPQHLYGYHGDVRAEQAHVIIRRTHIGAASNDVGFYLHPDGTVEAIISNFDKARFNKQWLQDLVKECGVQRAILRARRLGHTVQRSTDARGRPRLEVLVR